MIFCRPFIVTVKNAVFSKMANIFSIFLRDFTDGLKLLCAKFSLNWTNIIKTKKEENTYAVPRITSYLFLYL